MRPIRKLRPAHVKGLPTDLAEQHVTVANDEFSARKAHGRAAVAATARLMKQKRAMPRLQSPDQLQCGRCGAHSRNRGHAGALRPAARAIPCGGAFRGLEE